ncbi:MAG: hypothetical protein GX947_00720 [Tissierellia bacterium]|nr:hypothetical protein [Tissierellia bacterium]
MALGILKIIYIVLIAVAVLIQALLYINKNKSNNTIFIINMLLGMILAFIAFTSMPTNFTVQRILAIIFGVIAALAIVVKSKTKKILLGVNYCFPYP